jgi:thioredoxin 1
MTSPENEVVVMDFYADWCGPCRMMNPVIARLEKEYEGRVKFFKIDADGVDQQAEQYGVMSLPTFVFEKNRNEVGRIIGATSEAKMKEEIEKMLK